ncbi:MAG: enoyl-CoA hydratase-related protein [Bacteriovoracales bacterium]|nr:enoyl-CoA hydratase-related protein [Bacteriovoracales bacterium]
MNELLVDIRDRIGWVTLNRPKVHNALNENLMAQITKAFYDLRNKDGIRAVVLEGKGKSFCAGADLHWMKKVAGNSREENYRDSLRLAEMIVTIQRCPYPVVGRIHGAALGGGVGLVAACDYVLMEQKATWGLTEVNLGLVPAMISQAVIQKIGLGQAKAVFLSGEKYGGQRALDLGLAHELLPGEEKLDGRLKELLKNLKKTGPKASRMAKELIWLNETFANRPEKLKDLTCQMIASCRAHPEGQEGMAALLEKRRPDWDSL